VSFVIPAFSLRQPQRTRSYTEEDSLDNSGETTA
jgi:hypothetical protein